MQLSVADLLELQKVEKEISGLQRQLQALPTEEANRRQNLGQEREVLEQALNTAKEVKMQADKMDLEIRTREAEMLKVEGQLNTSRTNAEFTSFQNQINRLKKEVSDFEDRGLELMEQIESLSADATKKEKEFQKQERIFNEFLEQARLEKIRIEEEIKKAKQDIVTREKKCDPNILLEYQQLAAFFATRGGNVLAPVKGQVCSACGTKIVPNDQVKLSRADQLVKCKTCSRIIYLPGSAAAT